MTIRLKVQRHSGRFRHGNPRATPTSTVSGHNPAPGSINQPRYARNFSHPGYQLQPLAGPQPQLQRHNQPTHMATLPHGQLEQRRIQGPALSVPELNSIITQEVTRLCRTNQPQLSWVSKQHKEMVYAIEKMWRPASHQQHNYVLSHLYHLAEVLQDINYWASRPVPEQQNNLRENFQRAENLMKQVLQYVRIHGQQQDMNHQQRLQEQERQHLQQQQQGRYPHQTSQHHWLQHQQLPQPGIHQSQQIQQTHRVLERSDIELGPDGRRVQRRVRQVTSEVVEPLHGPMDMSQVGQQVPHLRTQDHEHQRQQQVQNRLPSTLPSYQQHMQSRIDEHRQLRPQHSQHEVQVAQHYRHILPKQVDSPQQQQQPHPQGPSHIVESRGPRADSHNVLHAVRRMHQLEGSPRPSTPTTPTGPSPPAPPAPSQTSPRPPISPSSQLSPRAVMSPPALPNVRSIVSPPVRAQVSPRQQISPRPSSRSSSVDGWEASTDPLKDAGRMIEALRNAALGFRNSKFRRDMNKMMVDHPYELLEIAVEKYEFVLPEGMTMERARAVLTKQNVAQLPALGSVSSPGML